MNRHLIELIITVKKMGLNMVLRFSLDQFVPLWSMLVLELFY